MNGILFRALLISLFTVSPIAVATAQETPPADQKKAEETKPEEKKAEPAKDDPTKKKTDEEKKDDAAPAEQPKPAEEPKPVEQTPVEQTPVDQKPVDQKPAEEPKPVEQKPAEEPKAAETPEAPPAPAAAPIEQKADEKAASGDDTVAAPQATATAETKPEDAAGKPWKVTASLAFNAGSAMFNKDPQVRKPSAGWSFDTIGSYTVTKLLEGNLDVFGRITMDQVLTNTVYESAVGQTKQFEYFFRDARLGASSPNIYKEKITGITISPSAEVFLPTSKASIAASRWFHFGLNLRLGRTFEKLGPGDLALSLGGVFRKPFQKRHVSPDQDVDGSDNRRCLEGNERGDVPSDFRVATHTDESNICGSFATSNFTFIEDIGVSYTWGPVSVGISYALYQIRYHRGDLGADIPGFDVRQSENASDNTWSNLSLGEISVGYTINDNWSLGLSIATYQNPYGTRGYKLRPPFWDPKGENLTTFELGATFVY